MVFNIDSSPPLLRSESLGRISGFGNGGKMLAQGCPWGFCHYLSYPPRPTAPFQPVMVKNDQQKNLKKPLPWKCLGYLSSWLKFSPFNDCALWLKEYKHPSFPWSGLQRNSWGFILRGFFPPIYIFFSLSFWLRNAEILMWCVLLLWALWPSERSRCVNSRDGKMHFIFLVYV